MAKIGYLATPISLDFRVTFIYLLSLSERLLCRSKVLLIIFIISISSHLILVLCFFSWFALLKLGSVLYTHATYKLSNTVNNIFYMFIYIYHCLYRNYHYYKQKFAMWYWKYWIVIIVIKHLEMIQVLALNNPSEVDMWLNNHTKSDKKNFCFIKY